ncbi:MAG: metallophosphoesterase [Candidatus Cloacimonetes bacterium]|nr:metallophosphoesterase [Candidatus Cloacimonadota bacterium]
MKKAIFIIFILNLTVLFSISIYDIQYTTDPGPNGTYPSPYEGQIVTTGGIVNAIDFNDGRFFIISSWGGISEWQGIYVYDNNQNVAVGDSVIIEAEVYEYWGFTELSNLISCNVISSGNSMPATLITSISNAINEARESTRAGIGYYSLSITQTYDEWGQWKVADGSGECTISTGFMNMKEMGIPLVVGYPLHIGGFVTYFWEEYQLNPISLYSISSVPHIISIQEQLLFSPEEFEIPIYHTVFNNGQVQSYQFELQYDPDVIEYVGYETYGTLSANGVIEIEQIGNGIISLSYDGDFSFENMETLLKLNFSGLESGNGEIEFSEFFIDDTPVEYFSIEDIILQLETIPIGDTLTVIHKPITNIPQITIPNEEFTIECVADESTTGWSTELIHDNKLISLNISSTFYDPDLERWKLTVSAPVPDIYELYDLVVNADGIVTDTTRNAVHLIPELKTNYSFIHITDSHLPTHIYYPDPFSLTDSTEVEDLRQVINDINLINPEFVLFTGDLVNEGEMEEFENRRVYTKAQKLLEELEVPFYLTSGNHDIGGWDSSPPSQGTARRNWWNFFGWSWLQNPPFSEPYYTQNYSFDYGPIHFIGMEAYLNYDSYMFNIYGEESFTDLQMQWLENDLTQASGSESQVIFYHYDFSEQIDLDELEIEMALYGHIHSNSGNINSAPYNLATAATCNGNRAYRVINVNDGTLEPTNTIYAGWDGEDINATFTPENNGATDSLFCYIENSQNLSFTDAKLKFIMPISAEEYLVYNGMITQIDDSGEFAICYVSIDIPANENISVSVVADFDAFVENPLQPFNSQLTNYPNPFNPSTTISFRLNPKDAENTELSIYNLKGQKVRDLLIDQLSNSVIYQVIWEGKDNKGIRVTSGIYFIKLKNGDQESSKKIMLLK